MMGRVTLRKAFQVVSDEKSINIEICVPTGHFSTFSSLSLVFRSVMIMCPGFDLFCFILFGVCSTCWNFTEFGGNFSHYFLGFFFFFNLILLFLSGTTTTEMLGLWLFR